MVSAAAAVAVLATATGAFAQEPPVIVLDAFEIGSATHRAASDGLTRVAATRGTVVIDLSFSRERKPKAPGLLERATEAYHAFDYDRAIELLGEAIADAEASGGAGLTPAQLSDLHLFRALSHTQKSDSAAAWSDLVRAAALDPSRALDSMQFPPRVVEAFGRAVDSVRADGMIAVKISVPQGCSAWIDGRVAKLREPVSMARGDHYIRVACRDHEPYGARKLLSADADLLPSLRARPTPSLERAASEAKSRGAATVLWVRESASDTGVTLSMQLADVDTSKIRGSVIVRPDDDRLAAAADELIAKVVDRPPEIKIVEPIRPSQKPWFKRPWVWGVVGGAVVATAIFLPFVLDSTGADSFDIGLGGQAP